MSNTIQYAEKEWLISAVDNSMTYDEATKFVKQLGGDWRLPSLLEIIPLIETQTALKETQKKLGEEWCWLNNKFSASAAWVVDFYGGFCGQSRVDGSAYVRAVRSGQSA
jgi:hypothetical protein